MSPVLYTPTSVAWSLLGFLHQRPMHGYEIYQQLEAAQGLSLVWKLKQSQLYALLARLEAQGHVTHTLQPQETHPPRKVFTLTAAGREAFQAWVSGPVARGRDFRIAFLAKLYFAREQGPEATRQLVQRQREVCAAWIADYRAQLHALPADQDYAALVLRFRVGQIEAMLAWLDGILDF